MYSLLTYVNQGLEGCKVLVEVATSHALPILEIIGLADTAVKEAKERIKMTFRYLGISLPPKKVVINLAPSSVKKMGTRFDVPMALALYIHIANIHQAMKDILPHAVFFGELGLHGEIKHVKGLLPCIISAKKQGYTVFFVPKENAQEVALVEGITIYIFTNFGQLVDLCTYGKFDLLEKAKVSHKKIDNKTQVDFGDIVGQDLVKRALSIAIGGRHNILLIGPPGCGKSFLASAVASVLPPLSKKEKLTCMQIHSLSNTQSQGGIGSMSRPCRTVYRTCTKTGLLGGGYHMLPGEISLAHHGVLIIDEIAEFPRAVLEILRQPIQEKYITIHRSHGGVSYPCDFMLIATMNPCPCGFYGDIEKLCTCSDTQIRNYQQKISGPLLDRFSMIIDVTRPKNNNKNHKKSSSQHIKKQITQVYQSVDSPVLGEKQKQFVEKLADIYYISPRSIKHIISVATTISLFEKEKIVDNKYIQEALHYKIKSNFLYRSGV